MKKSLVIIAAAIVMAALLGGGYFYIRQYRNERELFRQQLQDAFQKLNQGRAADTIDELNQLLVRTDDMAERAQISLALAQGLLVLAQDDDIAEAIRIYKSIVANQQFPNYYRAVAYNAMAYVYEIRGFDSTVMLRYVFNEEPYATPVKTGGLSEGLRWLYEQSDQTFPNPFAKLQLAFFYARDYFSSPTALTKDQQQALGQKIAQLIQAADTQLPGVYRLNRHFAAQAYFDRAVGLSASGILLGNTDNAAIDRSYEEAIRIAEDGIWVDPTLRDDSLRARVHYAISKFRRYGAGQLDEVKRILQPVLESSEENAPGFILFIRSAPLNPELLVLTSRIRELANHLPELRAFLLARGW